MKVGKMAESLEVEKAQLPWKCKLLKMYDDSLAEEEFHDDPKSYYRQCTHAGSPMMLLASI